jgi:hypothetical protein
VASEFAKLWGIKTPETCLIKVAKEHIPIDKFPNLRFDWFEKECFGSLFLRNSKEIDLSILFMFKEQAFRNKLRNKEDFLKIALFDIWIANEDRNNNNFNLLLCTTEEQLNFFYAIDHVNIFNSGILPHGIAEITEDDSIIKTDLAKILFEKNKEVKDIVDNLAVSFYENIDNCETELKIILDLVPESWGIDIEEVEKRIRNNIFTEDWKLSCEKNFREFVQSFIVN